jgi:hypothetical protein
MSSINEQRAAVAMMRDQFAAAQTRRADLRAAAASPPAPVPEEINDPPAEVETDLPEAALRDRPDTH